jgi:hypothetical protein
MCRYQGGLRETGRKGGRGALRGHGTGLGPSCGGPPASMVSPLGVQALPRTERLCRIGPEKGVIHIATGAVNNALWDMFAKSRKKPLWKLIADFTPVSNAEMLSRPGANSVTGGACQVCYLQVHHRCHYPRGGTRSPEREGGRQGRAGKDSARGWLPSLCHFCRVAWVQR